MKKLSRLAKSLGLGLAVLLVMVIYAYGFQVTKVNLAETRSQRRQEQLVRILRALAKPEIIEYEKEEFKVTAPIMVPCPTGGYTPAEPDTSKPYLVITPSCGDVDTVISVEGFNLPSDTKGPLNLIPVADIYLQMGEIETDSQGHFQVSAKLPRQRTSVESMTIQVITRRSIGGPHITQTAKDTWDKIIETVFLALLATTLGTLLAAPLSFFAARNLMKDVTNSLSSVALSLIAIPLGIFVGAAIARWLGVLSTSLTSQIWLAVAGLVIMPVLGVLGVRWALPQEELSSPSLPLRLVRIVVMVLASGIMIITSFLLSHVLTHFGNSLVIPLHNFGFLGAFIRDLGDILGMLIVLMSALAGAGVMSSLAGRLGLYMLGHWSISLNKTTSIVLTTIAGGVLFGLIGAGIEWLYQIGNPVKTLYLPAGIGAILGLGLAIWLKPSNPLPMGLVIYNIARTIFNALRSIEALIMVIVFVVWVGIGPFAGVLALSLHTIASLAKLYSEQVESILPGPLEAVKATGANRLQTIIYAVIPQIIPPYISFTMYRWDINVRMSTIIGFAGGGGIGFLLIQNINLLNYRAASVQMIAIAIVVAAMDYLSSEMRERTV
jgi:phosphonate ABC transporter permease subunit PhnE